MANLEIERKFLVNGDFKPFAYKRERIKQGYITSNSDKNSVRIRIKNKKGFITIKGATNTSGVTRFEWEKEIPLEDAEQLLELCPQATIDKTRYYIKVENHTFEVDEFYGDNEGLIIAEIELKSEDEEFQKLDWLGKEVTGNVHYYNSQLIQYPYRKWKENND